MTSLTYHTYCTWFLLTYGRPFAASEAEFLAAIRADIPAPCQPDPHYLDGIEDREGLYQ